MDDFGLLAGCLTSKNIQQNVIKKLSAGIKIYSCR